jgi:hypothetical protein
VTPEEAIDELVQACPSFQAAWRAYLREEYPNDQPGHEKDRLPYVDVSGLSQQVVAAVATDAVADLPAYFSTLERMYQDAGPSEVEFLTIGVLESIQNIALGEHLDLARFTPWLGTRTSSEWNALIAFWDGTARAKGAG